MTCPEISRKVSATYALRSVATRTGRDVWAVISVRNKSSRGVYVAVDGHLAASHPVKEPGTYVVATNVTGCVRRSASNQ